MNWKEIEERYELLKEQLIDNQIKMKIMFQNEIIMRDKKINELEQELEGALNYER